MFILKHMQNTDHSNIQWAHSPDYPFHQAESHLRRRDALIGALIDRYGPCQLGRQSASHYHNLVHTVIEQQLSVAVAKCIAGRLLQAQGGDCFEPVRLSRVAEERQRACGLSHAKIRCIRALTEAVLVGELDFALLQRSSDTEVLRLLTRFPGIGPWTAQIFLMFSLHRLDVLPIGDLALRNAMKQCYRLSAKPTMAEYIAVAQAWRPYRSIASWYLWASID